jgi:hypothetical protein
MELAGAGSEVFMRTVFWTALTLHCVSCFRWNGTGCMKKRPDP